MPNPQPVLNIIEQFRRPIISVNKGKAPAITNEIILMQTFPNVNPTGRTLIGKHSTKQINVSGTMPVDAIKMMKLMQMTGVQ